MDIFEFTANRIKNIAKSKRISIKQLLNNCELSINTISEMSKGKQISYISLAKMANYLDCSVDYLLGRTDNPNINTFSCYRTYTDNLNKAIVIDKLDIIKLTNIGFVCLNDDNETINYLYKDIGKSVFLTENEVISFIWSERKMKNE